MTHCFLFFLFFLRSSAMSLDQCVQTNDVSVDGAIEVIVHYFNKIMEMVNKPSMSENLTCWNYDESVTLEQAKTLHQIGKMIMMNMDNIFQGYLSQGKFFPHSLSLSNKLM